MIGPGGIRIADPQPTGPRSLWDAHRTFLAECAGPVWMSLARYPYARAAALATGGYRTSSPPADQSRTRGPVELQVDP